MRPIVFFSTVIGMLSYYELLLEIKLSKDIHFSKSYEILSKFFNRVMLTDNYLKTLHERKGVKLYSFLDCIQQPQIKFIKEMPYIKLELEVLIQNLFVLCNSH